MGLVPPYASVVCTDPAGRSCSRCWTARGLYPLPDASSVLTPRNAHPRFAACRCLSARGLYHLPGAPSAPTRRGAKAAAAGVRGARTPSRECRLRRPRGTLIQVNNLQFFECEGRLYPFPRASSVPTRGTLNQCFAACRCLSARSLYPPSARVDCTDSAVRSIGFITRIRLSARGLYPFLRASSGPTRGTFIQGTTCRCVSARGLYPVFCARRRLPTRVTLIQTLLEGLGVSNHFQIQPQRCRSTPHPAVEGWFARVSTEG